MKTIVWFGALLVAGCTGEIATGSTRSIDGIAGGPGGLGGGGGGGTVERPDPCLTPAVAEQPLRRLSPAQYQNVIGDLFGTQAGPLISNSLFPPTVITRGFANDAEANTVNTAQSNAIEDNAERIATAVLATPAPFLSALLPCTAKSTNADIDACRDAFITSFGARAYRRALTAEETAIARTVYDTVRQSQSATNAFAATVQYFVQSPGLLYRVERGTTDDAPAGMTHLSDAELASRLSFFLTDAPPDQPLREAVQRHELSTREQVASHARRLVNDPKLHPVLVAFHRDWLHLYEAAAGKDATLFPNYTAPVRASLAREPSEFIRTVMAGSGRLSDLLSGAQVPVDATLASYYQVTAPPTAWSPVVVPHRRGLLTLASTQAALGKFTQSGPIHRGNFFRNSVLCEPVLTLPANVDTSAPLAGTANARTARERLAPLMTRADCMGCHTQFNPMGYALENFDSAGQWRDQENGATIDASGSVFLENGPVEFSGPDALIDALSNSRKVQECYTLQWFRATQGRVETVADACSVSQLKKQVAASNGDVRELLVAMTQTDAFFFRRSESP